MCMQSRKYIHRKVIKRQIMPKAQQNKMTAKLIHSMEEKNEIFTIEKHTYLRQVRD